VKSDPPIQRDKGAGPPGCTLQSCWPGSPTHGSPCCWDIRASASLGFYNVEPQPYILNRLQGIPKLLWELGDSAPATSEAALRLLLDAGRTATPGGALAAALSGLQPQLAPLLGALLPLRRGGASAAPRFTAGPLARLPARCQVTLLGPAHWHGHARDP